MNKLVNEIYIIIDNISIYKKKFYIKDFLDRLIIKINNF